MKFTDVKNFFVMLLSGLLICGCAAQKSVIDEEYLEALKAQEKVKEVYQKGFEDGKNACRHEFTQNLVEEYKRLSRIIEYNEYLRGGFIDPPVIAEVVVPMNVSSDGKKVVMPHVEYVIVKDASFEARNLLERLLKQRKYVYIGVFFTDEAFESKKQELLSVLKDMRNFEIKKAPVVGESGFALIVVTEDQAVVDELLKRGGILL